MINKHDYHSNTRKPLRYIGFDYSTPGLYFITICSQNHVCLFGKIDNGKMILNDAGKMVEKWYYEFENKFQDVKCYEMVIMPNHFHFIIEKTGVNIQNGGSTLISIVQWFKTMTTNEYIRSVKQLGWPRFDGKLWQRSYWDHIIRNQKTYENICEYIFYNPINWKDDELYKP
ncbi:MAG: transposase [Dysgonamonadaceae bacterium]|nr:transposase [Dysgonamonadaceae bacterium]